MIDNQPVVLPVVLQEFIPTENPEAITRPIRTLADVKLTVSVVAGATKMTLAQAHSLRPGDVIELDRSPDATVDVFINGRHAARGDMIVIDDRIAAKLSEIEARDVPGE